MINEIFNPEVKNLFGIFKEKFFSIPKYQRMYSWSDEQVIQLFDDIKEAYDDKKPYFLGSMLICPPKEGQYYDVIDGQQRLITLAILTALLSKNNNLQEKKNLETNIVAREDLFEMINKNKLKIETGRIKPNDPYVFNEFLGAIDKYIDIEITKKELRQENNILAKYINTLQKFNKKIDEEIIKKSVNLQDFVNFLYHNVYVILIEVHTRDFALKIFQILNDRGRPLTSSDIIKADLIDESREEDYSDFDKKWDSLRSKVNENNCSLDTFFTLYLYYKTAENPKESLHASFKKQILKGHSVGDILIDLDEFIKCFPDPESNGTLFDERIDKKNWKYIYALRYLRWEMYINSIIMTALISKYNNIDKLLKDLRDFYYKCFIAGITLDRIKQISFNLIKYIKEPRKEEEIYNELRSWLRNNKVEDKALANLKEDLQGEKFVKPLLFTLEYHIQQDQDEEKFLRLKDRTIQLEHIYPQDDSKWNESISRELNPYLWKLGNLTLLSGRKNSSIKNEIFEIKKTGKSKIKGYKDSGFAMTRALCDYKQWDKNSVEDRQKKLIELIEQEFNFDKRIIS